MTVPSGRERLLVGLVDRARADPAAEAGRHGIALDAGLVGVAIAPTPKQPLAVSAALCAAAARHAADMLASGVFSHAGSFGTTPADRAFAAGWRPLHGAGWTIVENISADFREAGDMAADAVVEAHHAGLFASPGHRLNILAEAVSEIGVGQAIGAFRSAAASWPAASLMAVTFAHGGRTFVTGAVRQAGAAGAPGDPVAGVRVDVFAPGFAASAWTAPGGGYAIAVPEPGGYGVRFAGAGIDWRTGVLVGGTNVKVDAFVSPPCG